MSRRPPNIVPHAPIVSSAPPRSMKITVLRAAGLPQVGHFGRKSKFYVMLKSEGEDDQRTESSASCNPTWNKDFHIVSGKSARTLTMEVYGRRYMFGVPDDRIGTVTYNVKEGRVTEEKNIISTTGVVQGQLFFDVEYVKLQDEIRDVDGKMASLSTAKRRAMGVFESVQDGIDATQAAADQFTNVTDVILPLLENLAVFDSLMSRITQIHPYAEAAWTLISSFYKVYSSQVKIEERVRKLFNKMRALYQRISEFVEKTEDSVITNSEDVLLRVSQLVQDCLEFIRDFCLPSFMDRVLQNIVYPSTASKIDDYYDAFDEMEKQFENGVFDAGSMLMTRILSGVKDSQNEAQLAKLTLAEGASLVVSEGSSKRCLPETRSQILAEIEDWIDGVADDGSRRIFLLKGVAGSGKSAIAHTIASQYKESGRLGGSFGFDRNVPTRLTRHLFPHLARLLCNQGAAVKKSLADIIAGDEELLITTAVEIQFKSFVIQPLLGLLIARPIVFVIDAVDEILDGSHARAGALDALLRTFKQQMYSLPSNIRFLITARPEIPILRIFEECPGARVRDMANIPSTEADILLYTQARLLKDSLHSSADIDLGCCQVIARMSQTLFQWAFVACNEINNAKGITRRRKYDQIVSGAGQTQTINKLDALYTSVLTNHFDIADSYSVNNFATVISFILALREPLPESAVRALWLASGRDLADFGIVLDGARSLLVGVGDSTRHLQPSHTSFRDFLLDHNRSQDFTITVIDAEHSLVLASFGTMRDQLKFNICNFPSSYLLNKEVHDLGDRIRDNISSECSYACRSWADHLGAVQDLTALSNANLQLRLEVAIETFLEKELLFWLEVQSVLGRISLTSATISTLVSFLSKEHTKHKESWRDLRNFAQDAHKFVELCAPVAALSAPHIYLSALSYAHPTSAICRLYQPSFPGRLKLVDNAVISQTTAITNTISCPEVLCVDVWNNLLAAGTETGDIVLFDIRTGVASGETVDAHETQINDLKFSLDGSKLASCSDDNTAKIWDLRTGEIVTTPLLVLEGHTNDVLSIVSAPTRGQIITGSCDKSVRCWDASTGMPLWSVPHSGSVWSVAYSPNGTSIASGSRSHDISLWSPVNGDHIGDLVGHTDQVNSVVFSSDGKLLASGSDDKTVRLWDVATRQQIGKPLTGHTDWVRSVAFSPDGSRLASVSDDATLRLWNISSTPSHSSLRRVLGQIRSRSVVFSQDGTLIITPSETSITLWNAKYNTADSSLDHPRHHTNWVRSLALLPTGQLVSGSDDKTIRLWDLQTGEMAGKPLIGHGANIMTVAVSPDGSMIASGSRDRTVRLSDPSTHTLKCDPLDAEDTVLAVVFSTTGDHILSCTESRLLSWDVHTRQVHTDSQLDPADMNMVAFSPDRCLIARASSFPDMMSLWDTISSKCSCTPWKAGSNTRSIAFSPDGTQVVSGHDDGNVRIWDLSGNQVHRYNGHSDWVMAVRFSPDGRHLASGSDDSTIHIWDMQSGRAVGPPMQCGKWVVSLQWLQDSKLAAGLRDGRILVWDVSLEVGTSGAASESPVLFSHSSKHALPGHALRPQDNRHEDVFLDDNGFVMVQVVDVEEPLRLFWLTAHLRDLFERGDMFISRPRLLGQMGTIQFDLSQLAHGPDWARCYESFAPIDTALDSHDTSIAA